MLTVNHLLAVLEQVDPSQRDVPLRNVMRVREVASGEMEGALVIINKQVVGAALTEAGLFLFTEEEAAEQESYLLQVPEGLKTGNEEIDKRIQGIEPGEEWRDG